MNIPRISAVAAVFLFAASLVSAQTAVGTVSYLEGEVKITRNGAVIEGRNVRTGMVIQAFDSVETGSDGYVEVTMAAPSAGSRIKVKNNTSFYFEGTPENSGWFRTTFQLLRGSLSLRVGKLKGGESYQVQTDNTVAAVRGTEFNVDISPDRSVLITVPEGEVESTTEGRRLTAVPGTVTVINSGSSARRMYVAPEDVDLYREYWKGLRQDALRINARLSIQQYSRQWDRDLERLQSAMRELRRHDDVFDEWAAIMQNGGELPSTGAAIRAKSEISRGMLELRAALPVAERDFETLIGLEDAWKAGYAEGSFSAGSYSSASDFYRSFQNDRSEMQSILSSARWMIGVYRFIDSATGQSFGSGTSGIMDGMPGL